MTYTPSPRMLTLRTLMVCFLFIPQLYFQLSPPTSSLLSEFFTFHPQAVATSLRAVAGGTDNCITGDYGVKYSCSAFILLLQLDIYIL